MRRFTLSSADENSVAAARKARMAQLRAKLGRPSKASRVPAGSNATGLGSRLRRAAQLASHDENTE